MRESQQLALGPTLAGTDIGSRIPCPHRTQRGGDNAIDTTRSEGTDRSTRSKGRLVSEGPFGGQSSRQEMPCTAVPGTWVESTESQSLT
jgi:hypothetical protein